MKSSKIFLQQTFYWHVTLGSIKKLAVIVLSRVVFKEIFMWGYILVMFIVSGFELCTVNKNHFSSVGAAAHSGKRST